MRIVHTGWMMYFDPISGHKHTGVGLDGPPIPIQGIESSAKTSPGGTEGNRLAVTDASGKVGDSIRYNSQTMEVHRRERIAYIVSFGGSN